MEEVLFESETTMSRAEIAALLSDVATRLERGEEVTLSAGEESIGLEVPDRPTFEVKVERETEGSGTELSVEFEIEWDENGGGGGPLSVE